MTIRDYSATASDNSAIEGIGLSDAMLANALDDAIRAQMADSANFLLDLAKPTTTTGSANAYALSTGGTVTTYEDKIRLIFRANFSNTGACTINIDILGNVDLNVYTSKGAVNPRAGQIQSGGVYDIIYVAAISAFVVLNPSSTLDPFDTVADLLADTTLTAANTPVGTIISAQGFRYQAVASGGDITTAGGVQLKVMPTSEGYQPFGAYGPVADTTETVTGTDNTALLQAAIDTGSKVVIPMPPSGFTYGISQVKMVRGGGLIGPSEYTLAIRGISTSATITAGVLSSELRREFSFTDLYVENNRGGDAVDIDWAPDWNVTRCYFRSVSNSTLGTTAARGFNAKNSERGHFVGQCRFGGNPALRLVKDCNGVHGDNVVASGGSLGLAVDISGCQNVKMPLTIETSLSGVRIGDNTGDNATNGGWCSGINLQGSYFENIGTPVQAGHGFAVNGLNLDSCWLNNGALTFPAGTPLMQIGRVKNMTINGGRWVGEGTEVALKLLATVAPSGDAPVGLETSDIDLTVVSSVASLLDYSLVTSSADLATIAATNKIKVDDFGNGFGSAFEWISPILTANVTYGTMQITKTLGAGGRITSIELIEGDGGSLNNARLRVGSAVSLADILDKTWGVVNPMYEDQGVTNGFMRPSSNMRMALTAGTGGGTFRIKIKGFIDNS